MEEQKNEIVSNEEKLKYENNQLKAMLHNMQQQMEQMNMANAFRRLDYLFRVVEFKDSFSSDFVVSCVEEIEQGMTVKNEEEEK